MKKKLKPDSPFLWIVFFAVCGLCILGAGCVFADVDEEKQLVGACAFVALCLVLYCLKCVAQCFKPEESYD